MVYVVNGDLLDAKEDIIGHQCNCQGTWGSGIAKQIRNKYKGVYIQYAGYCKYVRPEEILGHMQIWMGSDGKLVANIFGQLTYGRNKDEVYTDYNALKQGLISLKCFAANKKLTVALPWRIGCGLANGDWDGVVYPMLEEIFSDYSLTLYKYEE